MYFYGEPSETATEENKRGRAPLIITHERESIKRHPSLSLSFFPSCWFILTCWIIFPGPFPFDSFLEKVFHRHVLVACSLACCRSFFASFVLFTTGERAPREKRDGLGDLACPFALNLFFFFSGHFFVSSFVFTGGLKLPKLLFFNGENDRWSDNFYFLISADANCK